MNTQNSQKLQPICDSFMFRPWELKKLESRNHQKLWRRTGSGREYQEYLIKIQDNRIIEEEIEIYSWRKNQHDSLVHADFVQILDNPYGLKYLRVFVSRTFQLPQKIDKLTWNAGLQLIKRYLESFEKLYNKFGPFNINDRMMVLDQMNYPKVWINKNFAKNKPHSIKKSSNDTPDQSHMVKTILKILQPYFESQSLIIKLQNLISSSDGFAQALNKVEYFLADSKIIKNMSRNASREKRKYFSKTPSNNNFIIQKKQQYSIMKNSYPYYESNSFAQIYRKNSNLQFKEKSSDTKKFRQKTNTSHKKNINLKLHQDKRSQNYLLQFDDYQSARVKFKTQSDRSIQKTQRRYFKNNNKSTQKNESQSKDKVSKKQLWSSRDFSFKSQKNKKFNHSKLSNAKNSAVLDNLVVRKRTQSTFNDKTQPPTDCNTEEQQYESSFLNPLTKSMTIIKKQLENLQKLKTRDYTKESTNDFNNSYMQTNEDLDRGQQLSGKLLNYKNIDKSIFKNQNLQASDNNLLLGGLKNSFLNRIDNLKHSQMIDQKIEESTWSPIIKNDALKFPPKQQKSLRKFNNNSMYQSITIDNPQPTSFAVPVHVPTALDKFARARTQSRFHQPIIIDQNFSFAPPINEALEQSF